MKNMPQMDLLASPAAICRPLLSTPKVQALTWAVPIHYHIIFTPRGGNYPPPTNHE